jgi:hypothetical protein
MQPSEEQIKALMTTVACAVCGAQYQEGSVEILGHRDTLWFLRVSCANCATCGLVAAMVRSAETEAEQPLAPEAEEPAPVVVDRPRRDGPVTQADVTGMRSFLKTFDGNFQALFNDKPEGESRRPAA